MGPGGPCSPFPGFVEDEGEQSLLAVRKHFGCVAANVQVFLYLHGRDGYPDPMTSYTQIGGKHMGDKRVEIKTESF